MADVMKMWLADKRVGKEASQGDLLICQRENWLWPVCTMEPYNSGTGPRGCTIHRGEHISVGVLCLRWGGTLIPSGCFTGIVESVQVGGHKRHYSEKKYITARGFLYCAATCARSFISSKEVSGHRWQNA